MTRATGQETEPRLLNGLRKKCPTLSAQLGLKESLAALRRGLGTPAGKKVLMIERGDWVCDRYAGFHSDP